jgi:hypothetical protein
MDVIPKLDIGLLILLAQSFGSGYTLFMKIWFSRLFIGFVFFFNMQCAVVFIIRPDLYAGGFELQGAAGEAMVRGLGVLFLMWNVPYALALWNPVRYRISLYEAIVMQAVGVVGESAILWLLPGEHQTARSTIFRFVAFDTGGWIALMIAAWLTHQKKS